MVRARKTPVSRLDLLRSVHTVYAKTHRNALSHCLFENVVVVLKRMSHYMVLGELRIGTTSPKYIGMFNWRI